MVKNWNYLNAMWKCAIYVCLCVCTCVCRSLSAPAAGSSSWPCTRPLSAFVPPRCRSVWVGVCICSQGIAPGAACSAWPVLRSKAASPGWTCPSILILRTDPQQGCQIKMHVFFSLHCIFHSNLKFQWRKQRQHVCSSSTLMHRDAGAVIP